MSRRLMNPRTTPLTATLAAMLVASLLSACGTAPPAATPAAPKLEAAFTQAPPGLAQAEPAERFWQAFKDPVLDELVAAALAANADIRVARARLAEARAEQRLVDAADLPTVDISSGAARVRAPGDGGRTETQNEFGLGAAVRWELDLLGRNDDASRAALADTEASAALVQAARLAVAAETARQYFELRGLQQRLRFTREALELQRKALQLVQARLEAGRGTALDTERARALVLSTEATVPALELQLVLTHGRIALLLGRSPQVAADARLLETQPLPALQAVALGAVGSPEALLRRRPDLQAAERQAAAAAARIGAAWKARWPRISLGGTLGLNAARLADLGNGASFIYNLGASLLWEAFPGAASTARTDAAAARQVAAVARYEQAVLVALAETEAAFATYTRLQRQAQSLFGAAEAAEKAALIAQGRFSAGVSDFLAVLDAERERVNARERLAQAQTQAAQSVVAIYKALAGGVGADDTVAAAR